MTATNDVHRLVDRFDHHDAALMPDVLEAVYDRLLAEGRLTWSEAYDGFWVATRYDDVKAVTADHETFCSSDGVFIPQIQRDRVVPLEIDPPEHKSYRTIFSRVLSPRRVVEMRASIHQSVVDLLDEFHESGGGDFVRSVAAPLPLQTISRLVGLDDQDAEEIRRLTDAMWLETSDEGSGSAFDALVGFLMQAVGVRVDNPRDDLISELLHPQDGTDPLPVDMVGIIVVVMAVAGYETTMNACSSLALRIAEDPERQQSLRADISKIPGFVEECLRLDTPAQLLRRTATVDSRVGEVQVAGGHRVLCSYAAANRDPRQFDRPERFDMERAPNRHLAFGWGIHQCVGAQLARVELVELVTVLTQQHPPVDLSASPVFRPLVAGHQSSIQQLPLAFAKSG